LSILLSGSKDGTVKQWNGKTGELIFTFIGHKADIAKIFCLNDEIFISSGRGDKTLRFWSMQDGELKRVIETKEVVLELCALPNKRLMALGSSIEDLFIWYYAS